MPSISKSEIKIRTKAAAFWLVVIVILTCIASYYVKQDWTIIKGFVAGAIVGFSFSTKILVKDL